MTDIENAIVGEEAVIADEQEIAKPVVVAEEIPEVAVEETVAEEPIEGSVE